MEPIELEEPVRPIKVIPDVDPLPPVQITERIIVDPDPEAFPESGVQHPDSLPVFMLAPIAPSDILDSKTNIEKLAALWLEVSEHKEQKQYETMVDEVLKCQNRFQESITSLIEAYEEETARLRSSTQ